jgi:NADH:ubiquinone oxidoreductase subunit 2 (subunit N)
VALYYYIKVVNAMFMRPAADTVPVSRSFSMNAALGISALATVGIGLYPDPFIRAVNWSLNLAQYSPVAQLMR